jgi:cyclohexanone monooxygenase
MSRESNEVVAGFVRDKIRQIVDDPEVAEKLLPQHAVGCKRPCVDTRYFETFNRPDVHLVDIRATPIERATPRGLLVGGSEIPLDCLVLATGFDAMTGALLAIDIRGRGGRPLAEKWRDGPRTCLGLAVQGFPNLFTITGPGSPSVLTNMIAAIEQHVDWIADCMDAMRDRGHCTIEATVEAEDDWVARVNAAADATLYPTCNSWYVGANVPGKPRMFMVYPGLPAYEETCNEIARHGYEGFELSRD